MADERKGTIETDFNTPLKPEEQVRFAAWKQQYAPQDSGADYDLRGAFLAGVTPAANGHFPDQFKKPNHETFSNESQYAPDAPAKAGSWNGEIYTPNPSNGLSAFQQSTLDPFKVDLFDTQSRKPVNAPSFQDIEDGIKNGKYGYGETKYINIIDNSGNVSHTTGEYLQSALNNGFRMETPNEGQIREEVQRNKGFGGDARVALLQLADEAALGIPETIFDSLADPLVVAKKEAVKQDHKIANALGGIAGTALSLELGSPLFKGAEYLGKGAEAAITGTRAIETAKALEVGTGLARAGMPAEQAIKVAPGIARGILGKTIGMGVEGGVIAAPQALTEAALGDQEAAAEHLVAGFGLGAALGFGSGIVKTALQHAPGLSEIANIQAVRSLNPNEKAAKAIRSLPGGEDALGAALNKNNLVRKVGEPLADYAGRINQARQETGSRVSDLYTKLDSVAAGETGIRSPKEIVDQFRSDVINPLRSKLGQKNIVRKLEDTAKEFQELAGDHPLSFKDLHTRRGELDDQIWKEGAIGITDSTKQELKKFRDIVTDELEKKGDKVASKHNWDFKTDLDKSNLLYRQLKIASSAGDKMVDSSIKNRSFSPSDYGIGIGSTVAGIATGNPWAIIQGMGTAAGHKWLRENGNAATARILHFLAQQSEQKGLLAAEAALKAGADKIDTIPSILTRLSKKRAAGAVLASTIRASQHDKMIDRLNELMADPEGFQQSLDVIGQHLTNGGAPNVGDLWKQKVSNTLSYLHDSAPRQALSSSPFAQAAQKPTDQEMASWGRKLEVADDPYRVLQHLANGSLHPDHIEALQKTNPATKKLMTQKVKQFETSGKAKQLPWETRQQLAMLTGESYDKSPPASFYQAVYSNYQNSKGVSKANNKLQTMPSQQTDLGRLTTGDTGAGGKERRRLR